MRLPDFIIQRQPTLEEEGGASFRVGREGRAATAHQRSNNTTDDRPRGKPQGASPSASKAAEPAAAAMEGHPDLNVWGLLGSFCPGNGSPSKEPSWKRVELRSKDIVKGDLLLCAIIPRQKLCHKECVPANKDMSLWLAYEEERVHSLGNKWTMVDVYQKCQDTEEGLGVTGCTVWPMVIENRR